VRAPEWSSIARQRGLWALPVALLAVAGWIQACAGGGSPQAVGTPGDEPSGAAPAAVSQSPSEPIPDDGPAAGVAAIESEPTEPATTDSPAREERQGAAAIVLPATLKVGLATDLERVEIGCCPAILEHRGEPVATVSSVVVTPAASGVRLPVYRLQVAALKDPGQAEGLARSLQSRFGQPADSVFDAGTGLFRVRVGRYPDREAAEAARGRLAVEGMGEAWVVSVPGEMGEPALSVEVNGRTHRLAGRWLGLRSPDERGLLVLGRRYRGDVLVYLNDRATLNVVNELPLEEYLRGVVPREMGPNVYGNLDALKAQAVAARTYTLGNLGEFLDEGYDICATPRCQVYGGIADEHPLSDRAIAETSGEVLLYDGELVDSLYTSTCGGHTEDVEVVFPAKHEAYLRGVPCVEAGVDWLRGRGDSGAGFPGGAMRRMLPSAGASEARRLSHRLRALAEMAGLPLADDRLTSLDRREVQRFLASTFDLALDARLFSSPHDVPYLLDHPPDDWSDKDLRLAAYLVKSGLLSGDLSGPLTADESERMLFHLALFLHVLEERPARYLSLSDGILRARTEEGEERWRMGEGVATFRDRDGEVTERALSLLPGDEIRVYAHGASPVAVVHQVNPNGAAFDRFSRKSSWTRFRSDAQLDRLVEERYPGLGFRGLEILDRGISGRVGRIRLLGDNGRSIDVEGLAVRWTLDVPDTWFTARRLRPADQPAGWLFKGRGWGHGVGLCQIGSYGMGLRGHDYRGILEHYYTGAAVHSLGGAEGLTISGR
jgi:stage II sporulation protein D